MKLVQKYSDELRINIFFDIDLSRNDQDNRTVHINLSNIYIKSENKTEFLEALSGWYDVQGYSENKERWYKKYDKYFGNSEDAITVLKGHEKWVRDNGVHFTPNIFLNDREYLSSMKEPILSTLSRNFYLKIKMNYEKFIIYIAGNGDVFFPEQQVHL
jgi:hypothetical protein